MITRAGFVAAVFGVAWLVIEPIEAGGPDEPAEKVGLDVLSWMSGTWVSEQGGTRSEEHWTRPAGGTMFGVSRTISGNRTVFFEYLRIEQTKKGIVYYASPKGRCPATAFKAVEVTERKVVFENPEHDFPQRIIYRLKSDGSLLARIEGKQGDKPRAAEWEFKRLKSAGID